MKKTFNNIYRILNKNIFLYLKSLSSDNFAKFLIEMRFTRAEVEFLKFIYSVVKTKEERDFDVIFNENVVKYNIQFPFSETISLTPEEEKIGLDRLARLLDGKRIAIVAPSSTIIGKKLGTFIDAHDLVVRVNFGWPIDSEMIEDLGSRGDILYHCCNGDFYLSEMLTEAFNAFTVVCYEENIDSRVLIDYCRHEKIELINITAVYRDLAHAFSDEVNTGLVAVKHLTSFPIKELNMVGFSFYQAPYYQGYRGLGAPKEVGSHDGEVVLDGQFKYFIEMLKTDERILIDKDLESIIIKTYGKFR